jgi:hypothetical protein
MLSVPKLNATMLSVAMLNATMLSVVIMIFNITTRIMIKHSA